MYIIIYYMCGCVITHDTVDFLLYNGAQEINRPWEIDFFSRQLVNANVQCFVGMITATIN